MSKHFRLEHSENASIFRCSICGSVCKQAHSLKEHYRDVHKKHISIDLAKSEKEPKKEDDVRSKQRIAQNKMPKLKCKFCPTICTGVSNLRRHMKKNCQASTNSVSAVEIVEMDDDDEEEGTVSD